MPRRVASSATPNWRRTSSRAFFTTLAQKSATITTSQVIGGWLYNTARNLALHTVRTEQRRRERELTAVVMQTLNANTDNDRIFEQLEPAMAELEPGERDAVVLRFLENRSFREVGTELGVSEDAARMRVNRALDRLRTVLDGKGVGVSAIVLTAALGARRPMPFRSASQPQLRLLHSLRAGLPPSPPRSQGYVCSWINAKVAAAIAGAALVAGTGTYIGQQKQIDHLRTQNQALEAQQVKLTTDVETAAAASRSNQDELERQEKFNGAAATA
jgi:RNA polymerase sigma factor (sigma-70 family)